MVVKAWVATHTGLPSIYSDTAVKVTVGDRVLADGSGPVLLSDALASPGVPTEYRVGSASYTLTRALGQADEGLITDASGRGVPGLTHVWDGDPVDWKSSVSRFGTRSARWSIEDPAVTGSSMFVLHDPALEDEMWRVVKRHGVVIIAPSQPTPGVPLRCVTVDSVGRKRLTPDGLLEFTVAWTESQISSGAAPVVTWGEWQALGDAAREKYGDMILRNLVPNPRGKYTSGTVEVRRNLASLGTVAGGTGLVVVNDAVSDPRFRSLARRAKITTPTTAVSSWWGTVSLPTVSVGDVYVYQIRVSSDLPVVDVNLGGGNTPQYTRTKLSDVDHGDGTRTLAYKLTITSASTNMTPSILLLLNLVDVSAGKVFLAGECCVEKTTALGDYFDGSYSPDPDLTPSWTGAENASPSVLSGVVPVRFEQDPNGRIYVSHDSEGNAVLTTFKNGTNSEGVWPNIGAVTEGQWVGISGWIYNPDNATSVKIQFGRVRQRNSPYEMIAPALITNEDMIAATSGFTYVSGAVQVTTSAPTVGVYLGTFTEPMGARFMVRDMMVSVADTQAEALAAVKQFFDGDGADDPLLAASWDGTPGQSPSTAKAAVGWQHKSMLDLARDIAGMPA